MKSFFLLSIICVSLTASFQQPHTWVFDEEHDLTVAQTAYFDSLFALHEKRTGNEIVLVTTPGYGSDSDIVNFSVNFGRKLGVGKKGRNNGVVIVFSKAKRQTRITTGYGTEKVLTDDIAQKIIDSVMIPRFKKDENFEGLQEGSKAIVDFLEKTGNEIR